VSLNLQRGSPDFVDIEVMLPRDAQPGTFNLGIKANPNAINFPDREENNLIWLEWTMQRFGTVDYNVLRPQWGSISQIEDESSVGSEITITFNPSPGFVFSGWAGSISSNSNPLTLLMPNHLSLSPGALPFGLASAFPDAAYSGIAGWHEDDTFGWFESSVFPWIFHANHGWQFFSEISNPNAYLFDSALGWILYQKDLYPYIYVFSQNKWLFYLWGSSNPRWFYDPMELSWSSF
jgi:hypothetical protein